MRKVVATFFLAGALVAAQGVAAADLSVAPLYKAPPPQASPAYNWSGFYLGANGGGGWGRSWWQSQSTSIDLSGAQVGGTAGYNWQFGNAVLGLEGDIDWSNLKGTSSAVLCPGCSTSDSWLSTVRGRAGYAFGGIMPYLTGGRAGRSAAALRSRCRATGRPRPNICTPISASSIAASIAALRRRTTSQCTTTSCAPA
jgi:outer membrane immunogenic protein